LLLAATPENVLFGQTVQSALPTCVLKVPATQARHEPPSGPVYPLLHTHTALDTADCAFALQFEHVESDVAPVTLENVFAEQFRHTDVPVITLYFPGTHSAHGPPFGPLAPALQMHAVSTELLATELELSGQLRHLSELLAPSVPEYVPTKQFVQAAVPFVILYLPTAHNVHTPPSGPVAPALQTHAVITVLPGPETVFGGQIRHAPAPVAPTVVEYVFTAQSVQLLFPVTSLYCPATQRTHTLPFPVAPALHRHSTLGTSASAYAVHARHAVAPTPAMYVPAAHDVQLVSAIAPLNLPASHSEQLPSGVAA